MEGIVDDMWSPYKLFHKMIEQTFANPTKEAISNFEKCLKRHKQVLSSILSNPPKNERNREQLKIHTSQGIPISGSSRTMVVSKDLVDECIIISDMYDLDEFLALELLCTAQRQMPQRPGLPRGIVAILLYYDGRRTIATSLRDLFQVTNGVSWVSELPNELTSIISSFTQSIVEDSNILDRIMDLLEIELDFNNETLLLTKNCALGPSKHQNQVKELFQETRLALAASVFNWSAQRSLPSAIVIRLIKILSKYKSTEASGSIDDVTLTMLFALLYSYDTSVLQKQEDSRLIQNLNMVKDGEFAQQIYNVLMSETIPEQNDGINSFIKFSFGLFLSGLRHASQYLQSSVYKVVNHDEQLVDDAIYANVFKFIYYFLLEKDMIYENEFFARRLHILFTDFIDFMHSKVTELRDRADETAKTAMSFVNEGLDPPTNLDCNFEMLTLCIGKFYKNNKADPSLCMEYWGPLDVSQASSKSTTRSVSLFKFIRLAGELLPRTLFVPYLKMIAGLSCYEQSARNTFNLLKQITGLTGISMLSWDHFFASLARYYANLRQEYNLSSETIYRNRAVNRSINPNEIEGLAAVLEVIRSVAEYDEIARVVMCEEPNWNLLCTLIGLLTCSIPLDLKADILVTLAALAKSKETANLIWTYLEAMQLIRTIPSSNTQITGNIVLEIEQNECRNEKYPLTAGTLDLLYSLIKSGVPKNLGCGHRKPGFDPYLTFIINEIFLKFDNRSYKDPIEKSIICVKCLKILHYLLDTYEVEVQHFEEKRNSEAPPGFYIMLQLQTKTDLLCLILSFIDKIQVFLDTFKNTPGKIHVEDCALYCLKIIRFALVHQDRFLEKHSIANSTILLCGLKKILLDVNPRTNNPDHPLNTTSFIIYSSWLPRHAFEAVKILHIISKQPNMHAQIFEILTRNEDTRNKLRQGFVECLEIDYIPPNKQFNIVPIDGVEALRIELQTKEAIIELIQDNLYHSSPNLAFFLLGFDNDKNRLFQNQRLGILEWSSNCTKSLINLLDDHLEIRSLAVCLDTDMERIVERSFCLLHSLCAIQKTSDSILRYIRSRNDFLYRHLKELPSVKMDNSNVIKQNSFLLKCAAIELRVTTTKGQLSRFEHICKLFLGVTSKVNQEISTIELNNFYTYNGASKEHNILLSDVLNCIEFEDDKMPPAKWNYFDNVKIKPLLIECQFKSEEDVKLVDIKKLRLILHNELKTLQNIAGGQRNILKEIESVLLYAVKVNEQRRKHFANIKFIEAWSQVTEVLFHCAPSSCLSPAIKQELIMEILQKILYKVTLNQLMSEEAVLLSGTILLLLANLRNCFSLKPKNVLKMNDTGEFKDGTNTSDVKSNALSLKYILKQILEWLIVSGVSSQKLRVNLYASLLNCLTVIKKQIKPSKKMNDDHYISRLDKSVGNINESFDTNQIGMLVTVLTSFGDKFMEIICHDCIAGHDICKMLALACIDVLLEVDAMTNFMSFIDNRGYLYHIVESLLRSNDELCTILNNIQANMKCLFVYESKMCMLLCLANNFMGAQMLLTNNILEILASMTVFNLHPDLRRPEVWQTPGIPNLITPIDVRFREILFPALRLCDCLITTLGTENHSVISQVVHFLLSHSDMIELVLRSVNSFSDLGLLEELALITGIIARTFVQETVSLRNLEFINDVGVNFHRIQKLMLTVLTRFIVSDSNFKDMMKPETTTYEPNEENKALHMKYFLEIAANVILYCRNMVTTNSADHKPNGFLFSPNFVDVQNRGDSTINNQYNLSIITNQLKGSVEYYHSQKSIVEDFLRKQSNPKSSGFDASVPLKCLEVTKQCDTKQNELSLCAFIAQQSLYLLWSHLDVYLRFVTSNIQDNSCYESVRKTTTGIKITRADLLTLKQTLVSVFNETFSKQLCSIIENENEKDAEFNYVLLRRIKSLIQFAPTE
uniref:Nuclear pore complex protein Nup205 n=1 Tax=Glossina brevipalpis TaxID=37001 RepID=A0A1A9WFW1_9MUSC